MPMLGLNLGLPEDTGKTASGPTSNAGSLFRRTDGTSRYLRPDGTSIYLRP